MDCIRRRNSPFYNDLKEFSDKNKIEHYSLNSSTVAKLNELFSNTALDSIILLFFDKLHSYLVLNYISKDKTPCCLVHSLLRISYKITTNNMKTQEILTTNQKDLIYQIKASFFHNVWDPLSHSRFDINEGKLISDTSDIETNKYVIIKVNYLKENITELEFKAIFDEQFLIDSKQLVTDHNKSTLFYYKLNCIIYGENNEYSLIMQNEKKWVLYQKNSINLIDNVNGDEINKQCFSKKAMPLFLIFRKTEDSNNVEKYNQEKQSQLRIKFAKKRAISQECVQKIPKNIEDINAIKNVLTKPIRNQSILQSVNEKYSHVGDKKNQMHNSSNNYIQKQHNNVIKEIESGNCNNNSIYFNNKPRKPLHDRKMPNNKNYSINYNKQK